MAKELVDAFNSLSLMATISIPSHAKPNEWHFDMRYIQAEPNPSHVLTIFQPHRERRQWSCVLPESTKEAAPTVVKGLLHAFVNKLASRTKTRGLGAPWRFTTEDTFLAAAIGHELRRVGVHPDAICNIGIANRSTISNAQEAFRNYFEARKSDLGLQGHTAAMVNTPGSITFDYTVPPWSDSALCLGLESGLADEMRYINKLLAYFRHRSGGIPSNGEDYDSEALQSKVFSQVPVLKRHMEEKPAHTVKSAADRGDG